MTLKLRPHHLLCILTYAGRGYSLPFVKNFNTIIERILSGESIQIVTGPDDICSPLLDSDEAHCRKSSVIGRDLRATEALSKLLKIPLEPNTSIRLSTGQIERMRQSFASRESRAACTGCEWYAFCSSIAEDNFEQSKLEISNYKDAEAGNQDRHLHPDTS